MDFKKYFISFIDSILEVDKDNKYALKYKNNAEFLKYNEIYSAKGTALGRKQLRTAILDKGMSKKALEKHLQKDDKELIDIIRIAARDNPIKLTYQDKIILNAAKVLGFKYVARYQTYNWSAFYELPILYIDTYIEAGDRDGVKLTDFNPKVNLAKEREVYLIDDLLNECCPIPIQMNDFSLDDLEENNTGFNF